MTAVIIALVLCMIVESMIIMVLLEQRRQILLQLKLLRQALEWRMENNEKKGIDCGEFVSGSGTVGKELIRMCKVKICDGVF